MSILFSTHLFNPVRYKNKRKLYNFIICKEKDLS